ncbi:MAG: diguanylate cyclase [bacterium]|nr:diguanylate cyclase [bacterium]
MDAKTIREVAASLFDDTPDAVVLYDREGCAITANEAARLLTGYALDEIVGVTYRLHVAPRDGDRVQLAVQTALAGGTDHFDTSVRHKDGTIVPVECYVFPAIVGGELVGIFAQARDIVALRSAESSLSYNQEKFRSLFEYHPDGIMEVKADGTMSRVNVALESETGYYGEQLVGKIWTELVAPEMRADADELLRSAMRGEAVEHDSFLLDRLGNRIDVQLKLVPLRVGDGVRGAYAIFKNASAQKTAERIIAARSEQIRRLYMVAASRGESLDEQIEATLGLGVELFGWDEGYIVHFEDERLVVRNVVGTGVLHKQMHFPLQATFARYVLEPGRKQIFIRDVDDEAWRDDPARSIGPWRSYFIVALDVADVPYGALVFASRSAHHDDIDPGERDMLQLIGLFAASAIERAVQSERIEQMAFNDALTGLPNRVLFNDRIENTMATARRYGRGFAVMYLDVDKFKHINDRFGHAVGDETLKIIAQRLRTVTRESDTVSRFGGDEFVILQPIVDGPSDAADLARKLNVAMQDPVRIDGVAHVVQLSVGIALYPSDGASIEILMEAADRALYRAKREGRNRWCFANAEFARTELRRRGASRREAAE